MKAGWSRHPKTVVVVLEFRYESSGTSLTSGSLNSEGECVGGNWDRPKTLYVRAQVDEDDVPDPPVVLTYEVWNYAADTILETSETPTVTVTIFEKDITEPSVSIAAGSSVQEGTPVEFTLTRANDDMANALTVNVSVSQTGSVLIGSAAGQVSVRFEANEATKTLTLDTEDDNVEEEDGIVTATITAPSGYQVAGPASATVTVMDNDEDLANRYDQDHNGVIDRNEAIAAITDYFADRITRDEVLEVIRLYFAGSTRENESPQFPEGPGTVRSVAENSPTGTDVGNPVAAADDDDALAYSLGGVDASFFTVEEETGQIKVGAGTALDYETRETYTISVTATDPQGATDAIIVTIMVTDVDLGTPYDRDHNEVIDRNEAIAAITDYFADRITRDEVLGVITLYFAR